MGAILETKITDFSGGMTPNSRSKDTRYCRVLKHFDSLSAGNKLTPYRSHESEADGATAGLALFLSSASKQYALGWVSSSNQFVKIYERASIPAGAWTASTTGESSGGARSERFFVLYKDSSGNPVIFTAETNLISSYRPDNAVFNEAGGSGTGVTQSITYTDIAQGLVHSKDDILYIPYDNKIAKYDAGTPAWTVAALTLPADTIITCICEYGNYLAIAAKSKNAGGRSIVYLWDRNTSLTTLSEKIDWGTEILELIEEVEGFLIGISRTAAVSTTIRSKVIFKYYTAQGAKQFLELPFTSINSGQTAIAPIKQKMNNRLYFMMGAEIDGTAQTGIWSIGRLGDNPFALSVDRLLNNDTAITLTNFVALGFQLLGDYMTLAYKITNSTTFVITRTDDTAAFTASSDYESLIFNAGDSSLKKDLIGITIMTEPLPAGGQVTVGYKKDAETSFTTILTHDTDDSISDSAVNIESSGATLPKDYKEIQFQIISTGNAVVTGFSFKEEITGKRPYS